MRFGSTYFYDETLLGWNLGISFSWQMHIALYMVAFGVLRIPATPVSYPSAVPAHSRSDSILRVLLALSRYLL